MSREKKAGIQIDMQKSPRSKTCIKYDFKTDEKTLNKPEILKSAFLSAISSKDFKKSISFQDDDSDNPKLALLTRRNRDPYIGPYSRETPQSCPSSAKTTKRSKIPVPHRGAIPKKTVTLITNDETVLTRSKVSTDLNKDYISSFDKEDEIIEKAERLLYKARKIISTSRKELKKLLLPTFEEIIRNPDIEDPPEVEAQLKKTVFMFIREYELQLKEVNEILGKATGHGFHPSTIKSRKFLAILLKDIYLRDSSFGEYDLDGFFDSCEHGESEDDDWRLALNIK